MRNGQVKFYNSEKGYGFILDDETGKDIFVHATGLSQGETIKEGDSVQFNIGQGKKGDICIDVTHNA